MIVLSLLTSFLVFKLFPLSEDTSELLGRVRPDIRDVLIAFFGGLALMVARTKKGTIASVIFGVAIATALMPPLCTAGYGLAIGNYSYFFGAMYLFIINTIFIGLATFLVLKLLSFPMLKYVNSAKRKRIAKLASALAVLVMIPAVYTFVEVYKDSRINNQIALYIKEVKGLKALQLIDHEKELPTKTVYLNFFNEISEATHNVLENNLKNEKNYPDLSDFTLKIKGSDTKSFELITTAYKEKRQELQESKNSVAGLQKEIAALKETVSALNQRIEQNAQDHNDKVIAFSRNAKDAKIRYHAIEQIGFTNVLSSKDFIKIDTIPTLTVSWDKSLSDSIITIKELELKNWLQTELSLDTLSVRRIDQ